MIDLIDTRTLLTVGSTALVLAGLISVLSAVIVARRKHARRRQLVAVSEVTRDWAPTWKINAVTDTWVMENEKDDIPSNFVLRIEENRMVRDIGGGEVMEIRWRPPTKAEVREIVRRYHEVQVKVPPVGVIEFERQLQARASHDYTDNNRDGDDRAMTESRLPLLKDASPPTAPSRPIYPDLVAKPAHPSRFS
jgi:hypothetical protein